jgi:hypothetical protein
VREGDPGGRFAPGLVDRYLAWTGYSGQLTSELASPNAPGNLFQSVAGNWGAEGRFVNRELHRSWQMLATRHHGSVVGLLPAAGGLGMWCGLRFRAQTQRQRASH